MSLSNHPNWAPEVQRAHSESELLGGCELDRLPVGGTVLVFCQDAKFILDKVGPEDYLIAGHPKWCPKPMPTRIAGSIYHPEGSMLRWRFIGREMFMEFSLPEHPRMISSKVLEIYEI